MEKIIITRENFNLIEKRIKAFLAEKNWSVVRFVDTSLDTATEILNRNGNKPKKTREYYEYKALLQVKLDLGSYKLAGIPFINLIVNKKRLFTLSGEEIVYFFEDKERIIVDAIKDTSVLTSEHEKILIVITNEIK